MAYSYSSISKFEQCPRAYYHHYVIKDTTFEQSEPAQYGSEMHDALDKIIQGQMEFTPRYEFLKPIVTQIKAIPGTVKTEFPISFKEDWSVTDWRDKTAYIKGKSDCTIFHPTEPRVLIKDWKFAGKVEPQKYTTEMEMFAFLHFKRFSKIEQINAGLVWLKTRGPESKFAYNRKSDFNNLEDTILGKIARIDEAVSFEKFPCKPSGLCFGWCAARNCEKWKPKKTR